MQETRIDPCGRRLIRSFIPLFCAVTTAPVFGAVTVTPMPLQAIRVPALTLGISAVDPMTLIVCGVDPLYASVAPPPPLFFPEPQPARAKPRTARTASARIDFTRSLYPSGPHACQLMTLAARGSFRNTGSGDRLHAWKGQRRRSRPSCWKSAFAAKLPVASAVDANLPGAVSTNTTAVLGGVISQIKHRPAYERK